MVKGIDHCTINVKNLDKTLYFYGTLLGLKSLPSVDMGDHVLYYFSISKTEKLELVIYKFPTRNVPFESTDIGNCRHLAFAVDDIYYLEKKLADAGYPFHCPVSYVEELRFQGGVTCDPNGFEIEFVQH